MAKSVSFSEIIKEAGISRDDSIKEFLRKYRRYIWDYDTFEMEVTVNNAEFNVIKKLLSYSHKFDVSFLCKLQKLPANTEISLNVLELEEPGRGLMRTFYGCSGLSKISLHGSCNFLGTEFAKYCYNLTEVDFSDFTCKTLGTGCFSGTSIKELMLPEGLEEIGRGCFNNNSYLERIKFPSTITSMKQIEVSSISAGILDGCTKLKAIELPKKFRVTDKTLSYFAGKITRSFWGDNGLQIVRY